MARKRKRRVVQRSSTTTMHDLPDDCLALVFPLLSSIRDRDSASLTCRRWRALDALSRHSLHFSSSEADPSGEEWPRLHQRLLHALQIFPRILSLSVSCSPNDKLPDFFLTLFQTKALAQLQSVDLDDAGSGSQVDDAFVQSVADCCPALKRLGVSMCAVTDVGLHALAHGCRHLESLDVSHCNVTDTAMDALLTMCPNMEVLSVVENYEIKGWGFRHGKRLRELDVGSCWFTDEGLMEALQGVTSLETLELGNLTVDIEALGEGCPTLALIGTYCKQLVKLELSWSGIEDFSLQAIVQGCSNLRVLEAMDCCDVTYLGWQAVARSCLKLEVLNVQACEQFHEDSLLAIYKGCPSLTNLQISQHFVPPHPVIKLFQVSRPTVDVAFYDDEGNHCPIVLA